ncbi:hypothetical protein COV19_01335 [Candidatus Woesearchaeota archaeon CG10_big_fil_rev_8_21_14_0_10_44_13]|nr:MAG: hypothetical protein COV19_01335 [Candidatus Woesearchaeota archaeon CG10_big_fil_rev_8_21_14_0_10_44_13]
MAQTTCPVVFVIDSKKREVAKIGPTENYARVSQSYHSGASTHKKKGQIEVMRIDQHPDLKRMLDDFDGETYVSTPKGVFIVVPRGLELILPDEDEKIIYGTLNDIFTRRKGDIRYIMPGSENLQ